MNYSLDSLAVVVGCCSSGRAYQEEEQDSRIVVGNRSRDHIINSGVYVLKSTSAPSSKCCRETQVEEGTWNHRIESQVKWRTRNSRRWNCGLEQKCWGGKYFCPKRGGSTNCSCASCSSTENSHGVNRVTRFTLCPGLWWFCRKVEKSRRALLMLVSFL